MMKWLQSRIRSLGYAFEGILSLFKSEPNAKIHLGAAILVVLLGIYFKVNSYEWCILILCISMVFSAEMINTSIESFCDFYSTEKNQQIKKVKDIAAGAVLITALSAIVAGTMIFWPYIRHFII
ncbi:MAG: diacylglycerol kinase family protein [Saprospiraceae bacterium]|nr:diacylglycerol kinase family protein [Saprospiraceae bacterium]